MTIDQVLKLIIARRKELKISQAEIAAEVGIHRPGWTEVEAGTRYLRAEEMLKAFEVLEIDVDIKLRKSTCHD